MNARADNLSYHKEIYSMARIIDHRSGANDPPALVGREILRFVELMDQRGISRVSSPGRRAIDQTNITDLAQKVLRLETENARLRHELETRRLRVAWTEEVVNEMQRAYDHYGMGGFWNHCSTVMNHLEVDPNGKLRLAVHQEKA